MDGERDYYVHGLTGETTFEKPIELMTEQERTYYENFRAHQKAAQEHVEKISKLQFDLEAVTYERDTMVYDSLNKGPAFGGKKKTDQAGGVLQAVRPKQGGIMSLFSRADPQYRQKILKPDDRSRGKHRSDYIKGLLEGMESDKK